MERREANSHCQRCYSLALGPLLNTTRVTWRVTVTPPWIWKRRWLWHDWQALWLRTVTVGDREMAHGSGKSRVEWPETSSQYSAWHTLQHGWNFYFCNFSVNCFELWLTKVNCNYKRGSHRQGGGSWVHSLFLSKDAGKGRICVMCEVLISLHCW